MTPVLYLISTYWWDRERFEKEFHFGKRAVMRGIPPPPRSIGMFNLAENCDLIYGAQQLRGKILSRKDLAAAYLSSLEPLSIHQ